MCKHHVGGSELVEQFSLLIFMFSMPFSCTFFQEDRENILRARATGNAVLTSPFRLLGSSHLGVVLTFPVYRADLAPDVTEEERVEATAG
jgi:CHASE domain